MVKDNNLKTLKISQGREKAQSIADLKDFDSLTIQNYVMEVNLKGKDVEYEKNLNPRYAHNEKDIYKGTSEEQICQKSNNNLERLVQIVNNANRDFRSYYQYIVFSDDLIKEIHQWLDRIELLGSHMKYGKVDEDIKDFKRIFPKISKKWLVVDGNSYFSTIHQIYLVKNQYSHKKLPKDIINWSYYYAAKPTKGKAYISKMLSKDEYEKDIQMLQLISLVLEKNLHSWAKEDVHLFYEKLYRILFIISYTHCIKTQETSADHIFSTMQAVRYLTLPTDKISLFKQTKRVDYLTLNALFKENVIDETILQATTYNIKVFRGVLEGLLTKNMNHLKFDYVLDCMNEVYLSMVKYQNNSLKLLEDTTGQSARDRLTRIDSLFKEKLKDNLSLRDELINEQLPIQLFKDNLDKIVQMMIETYNEYLSENLKTVISRNETIHKRIEKFYSLCQSKTMTIEQFEKTLLKVMQL